LVSGPNADNQTILGDWTSKQPNKNTVTILEALKEFDPHCQFEHIPVGGNPRNITKEHVMQAAKAAQKADLAVLVVGENSFRWAWNEKTCGENSARSDIGLAGLQQELVKAVYETGTPTIVILVNGRPLATEWIADNISTIIEAWEPGSMGGVALAQILYGEVNPSGKLSVTIPRSAGHLLSVYNHKPTHYFHKYIIGKSTPLFEFGYGLSYSEFNYQNLRVNKQEIKQKDSLLLKVEVANIGEYDGQEVVQLYIRDKVSSVTRPVKELKAFRRIALKAGEVKQVTFVVTPQMLQFLDKQLNKVIEPGEFVAMVGGSSKDEDLICIPFSYQ
jgi:beta-glucosidase